MPNTNCWANGIDTTCASLWNSRSGYQRAGTAISRRHILASYHFSFKVNDEVLFYGSDGNVYTNTIISGSISSEPDLQVLALAQELPPSISHARILPENYAEYIWSGYGLPCLFVDQDEHMVVQEFSNIPMRKGRLLAGMAPHVAERHAFHEGAVNGDSGSPRFLVVGNQVVLMNITWYGGDSAMGRWGALSICIKTGYSRK